MVNRHPVALYTSRECDACTSACQWLQTRGVPFAEKTVDTQDDVRAFNAQENSNQLPLLKIGAKQLTGWQQADWSAYLDAAGYPQQSKLPAGYVQPEATPLAPPKLAPSNARDRNDREEGERPFAPAIGNPPGRLRF